jgi:signal peptidase
MSVLGWAWRVTTWLVLFAALAALALVVVVPRLAGATPYTVLTGSMEPDRPPGTLIVVRPAPPEEIGVGTVITYQLESEQPTVITHRVNAQAIDGEGEPVFQTQGDANPVPDPAWVRPVQIRGQEWYAVPYLGYVSNVLTGKERQMGIYLLAALLLGYAIVLLGSGLRERRGSRSPTRARHV